jgi:hypothetical protein
MISNSHPWTCCGSCKLQLSARTRGIDGELYDHEITGRRCQAVEHCASGPLIHTAGSAWLRSLVYARHKLSMFWRQDGPSEFCAVCYEFLG